MPYMDGMGMMIPVDTLEIRLNIICSKYCVHTIFVEHASQVVLS